MKRMTMALATVAGLALFAGSASADPGGFAPPAPGGAPAMGPIGGPGTLLGAGQLPPGRGPEMYGWSPVFRKFFTKGGGNCGSCDTCGNGYGGNPKNPLQNPANWAAGGYGVGGPAYNPHGFPPGAGGAPMQGTLVFPNQPFVRSPRDFFMLDLNK